MTICGKKFPSGDKELRKRRRGYYANTTRKK